MNIGIIRHWIPDLKQTKNKMKHLPKYLYILIMIPYIGLILIHFLKDTLMYDYESRKKYKIILRIHLIFYILANMFLLTILLK